MHQLAANYDLYCAQSNLYSSKSGKARFTRLYELKVS